MLARYSPQRHRTILVPFTGNELQTTPHIPGPYVKLELSILLSFFCIHSKDCCFHIPQLSRAHLGEVPVPQLSSLEHLALPAVIFPQLHNSTICSKHTERNDVSGSPSAMVASNFKSRSITFGTDFNHSIRLFQQKPNFEPIH